MVIGSEVIAGKTTVQEDQIMILPYCFLNCESVTMISIQIPTPTLLQLRSGVRYVLDPEEFPIAGWRVAFLHIRKIRRDHMHGVRLEKAAEMISRNVQCLPPGQVLPLSQSASWWLPAEQE